LSHLSTSDQLENGRIGSPEIPQDLFYTRWQLTTKSVLQNKQICLKGSQQHGLCKVTQFQ